MNPKLKKHLKWIAPLVLILALWGYHYLAANQAEQDLDEAIQEFASNSDEKVDIKYEFIKVHPFDGDVRFGITNFFHPDFVVRFTDFRLDLTYWDFLTIYFRGADYALQNINNFHSEITEPYLLMRGTPTEYRAEQLSARYRGNFFDLLSHFINEAPYQQDHTLRVDLRDFRYTREDSPWGTFGSETLSFSMDLPANTESMLNSNELELKAATLGWQPPEKFQEKYGFFIRGFDYEEDNIPVDSLRLQLQKQDQEAGSGLNLDLYNNLFQLKATADLIEQSSQLVFLDGVISLPETSDEFRNFLDNAQRLFGVKLPDPSEPLFEFDGPISDPDFRLAD